MQTEMSTYLAGVATAALAIAAGFGGGVIIANSIDTHGAIPAPGMSRIERTKREEPRLESAKPADVAETNAQAPRADEPAINPLAEAQPLRADASAAKPAQADASNPEMTKLLLLQSQRQANEVALPAAIQTISSPRGSQRDLRRDLRHARAAERPQKSVARQKPIIRNGDPQGEARNGDFRRTARNHQNDLRRGDPDSNDLRHEDFSNDDARYVARTENGRSASTAEVEFLKRGLRGRHESRVVETRVLSYEPERRAVFPHFFPD